MRCVRVLAILVVAVAFSSLEADDGANMGAQGASVDDESRRAAFAILREAEAALDAGRPRVALERFGAAYDVFPHPRFLVRMGICYQRLGDHEAASEKFERFLLEAPDAPDRKEVAELLEKSRAKTGDDLLPLSSLVEPGEKGEPIPMVVSDHEEEEAVVELRDDLVPVIGEDERLDRDGSEARLFGRWWFWAVAAGAVAGGAVYAGTRPEPVTILPAGSLGTVDRR